MAVDYVISISGVSKLPDESDLLTLLEETLGAPLSSGVNIPLQLLSADEELFYILGKSLKPGELTKVENAFKKQGYEIRLFEFNPIAPRQTNLKLFHAYPKQARVEHFSKNSVQKELSDYNT